MQKLERFTPYALATLRIVTALIFIEHGTQKLFGFPPSPDGLPPAGSLLWFGAWLELVGGSLLLLGLFTRPTAFIISGEMAVAYWMFHAPASVYPALNGGDAAILYTFVFLLFVFTGPGAWSLDNWLKASREGRSDAEAAPRPHKKAFVYRLLQRP